MEAGLPYAYESVSVRKPFFVAKKILMRWIYVPKDEFDYYYGAEEVKAQIDYDCLMSFKDDSVVKMVEEIKDLMVDVLCGERTVISEGKRVSEETAKAAYRKITFEHVQYVLHSLVNYPDKISRIDRFLTTSLFNSVYTMMNSTFAGFEHDMGMKLLC